MNQPNTTSVSPTEKSLKQYWIFFSGQLFSLLGSSVVQFALIWWLTITSQSNPQYADQTGFILGLASIAGFAPFVLTSLFAGVLVDRWNRKIVIASADGLQAFFTGILMLLFYLDQITIPLVLVILAIRAVAQGFHNPAVQAIIPIMVPQEKLTRVNSFEYLFNGVINLIGPAIGALLIEFFGVDQMANILWIDVLTFAIAVIPVLLIQIPDITKVKRESGQTSFRREFTEGISFIYNSKGLLPLLFTFTIVNILSTPVFMLLPLVVADPKLLNGGAEMLAYIIMAFQAGSIIGSFVLTRWKIFSDNITGVISGQSFINLGTFVLGLSAWFGSLYGMLIGGVISGMAGPFANIHSQTIWQSVVPPELQGRVMSVRMVIAWIMIPVSQLLSGYLADIIGPVMIYLGGAGIGIAFIAYTWFMTDLSDVETKLISRKEPLTEMIDDITPSSQLTGD